MNKIVTDDILDVLNRDIDFTAFKNKTIMVTGANSQIASYLVFSLLALNKDKNYGMKVIGLVRNIEKAKRRFSDFTTEDGFSLLHQDVSNPIDYRDKVDIIIHAASPASAYIMTKDPISIIRANTVGTLNVLEFAREKKVEKVVFLSTREVYGDVAENSIKETDIGKIDQLEIRSCYPEGKRMAENMLVCYQYQYQVPYLITRIAHTYGPLMEIKNDGRIMSDLINFVVNENEIRLNSDGSAIRAFCYITDTIDAILRVVATQTNEVFNIANEEEPISIKDLAELLIELQPKKKLTLSLQQQNSAYSHGYLKTIRKQLDTVKIREIGWAPKIGLKTGLQRTLDFFEIEKQITG